jgi:hypothetical protein
MVWPHQKDARGQNTNINYGMDTRREKKKRTSKKNVDGRSTISHARNVEQDQWRNREVWRLVSGRRRQLLQNRISFVLSAFISHGWIYMAVQLNVSITFALYSKDKTCF